MKRTLNYTIPLLIIGLLLVGISCKTTGVNPPQATGELRVSTEFANQTSQFAFEVAKRVVAAEDRSKNIFVSPLSLHIALGMVLNGTNGQTAQEIQKMLGLDAQTLAQANATYQNLMTNLPIVDPKVTLSLANSVWYRNTFSVANSFQDTLKQTFLAEIAAQNFDDPATLTKINNWASQKTNGKIPKVLDQIASDNVMFLMNTLYFKGDWKSQFDAGKTVDTPFTLASGTTTSVRMMRLQTDIRVASHSTYLAFELPYGDDKFAMTILLPATTTTADEVIKSLDGSAWAQLQNDMATRSLDFGLPKFTFSYGIKLNAILSTMGMPTAFTDSANFSKMSTQSGLALSFVKQNTFVAVDEQGTEAAAVTIGGVVTTSVPVPTLCNRPFVFVIHEKTSGTVLFVGKIADPNQTTNS